MAHITFITGGARSGKSSFAQNRALDHSERPVYLATSRIWDDDFRERVERHKKDRDNRWENLEEEKELSKLNLTGKTVVVDCITLWLNNYFFDNQYDINASIQQAKAEWDAFIQRDCTLIVVSNELGMGVHASDEISRKFTDLQGWMNQHIAKSANEVYLMVSGIPLKVK